MRSRVAAVFAVLVSIVVTPAPAHAQGTFYEIDMGRAAFAVWEDFRAQRFGFAVVGQGIIWNSDVGEPVVGDVGCAAVGTMEKSSFGCGELSSFEMSDDLTTASGKGTFDATTFDFRTGKTAKGTVSFSASWTKAADFTPHVDGGYFFDGAGFGTFMNWDLGRDVPPDGIKGKIKSPLGAAPATTVFGRILVGPSIAVEMHG